MTQDITRAAEPVADKDCIRFTVFFEVRGPQVFEVSAQTMVQLFGARGYCAEEMLAAFRRHEGKIVAAARAYHGPMGPGALHLDNVLLAGGRGPVQ